MSEPLLTRIHVESEVETKIGDGCMVWRWSHITKDAVVGKECTIGEHVFISGKIGDRCRVQNNATIYYGVTIGNDCLIGPGVVTTNDHYPELPVGDWSERFRETRIGNNVSIGANSTIICGVTIGNNVMIGAGSVVTKDIPDNSVGWGNPFEVKRYKDVK